MAPHLTRICGELKVCISTPAMIGVASHCALHFAGAEIATMTTGKKPASNAGKELGSSKSTKAEKTVAGSALAQAPKGKGGKSK